MTRSTPTPSWSARTTGFTKTLATASATWPIESRSRNAASSIPAAWITPGASSLRDGHRGEGLERLDGERDAEHEPRRDDEQPRAHQDRSPVEPVHQDQRRRERHQADPLGDEEQLAFLIKAALGTPQKPPVIDNPFVGLRSMTERDSRIFFGRKREIAELIERMRRNKLVAIVADSGSGKSSLAMAGIAPRFRGGALAPSAGREIDGTMRHVVVMRPGENPAEGLKNGIDAAARTLGIDEEKRYQLRKRVDFADAFETVRAIRCDLPPEETQTLLIVDQFEELLTETPENQRDAFVSLLLKLANNGTHVLLTVRADYWNLTSAHAELWTALNRDGGDEVLPIYKLRGFSPDTIVDVVTEPLKMAGHEDADERAALVTTITRDMMNRPGDVALIQMALDAVWRRRVEAGGLLEVYQLVGGVSGALAHEAKEVHDRLSADEKALLLPLFVRLIRLGETGGVTRRAVDLSSLDEARRALARKLTEPEWGRLLVSVGEDSS